MMRSKAVIPPMAPRPMVSTAVDGTMTIEPLEMRCLLDGDVIFSEIMYHPTPPTPDDLVTYPLLTEDDLEYIEIFNPGTEAVDLSDYYLTDANYAAGNQHYWRIAEGTPTDITVGGGVFNDFHARFPDGATIASHEYQTV